MTLQLTSVQMRRRARKLQPKPEQIEMFELPPPPVAQSPRAAAIAAEETMQNEAKRVLAAKAGKAGSAAKPSAKKGARK